MPELMCGILHRRSVTTRWKVAAGYDIGEYGSRT